MTDDEWAWCNGSAPYIPPPSGASARIKAGGPVWLYGTEDGTAWEPPSEPQDDAQ